MKQVFWIIAPWFNDVLRDCHWVLKRKALKIVYNLVTENHFQKCKFDHEILQLTAFQGC